MERIAEARLKDSFIDAKLTGCVHSRFRSVINLNFFHEERMHLITVLPEGYSGIPDSLVIGREYFKQLILLPTGTKVQKEKLCFKFDTVSEPLMGDSRYLYQSTFSIGKSVDSWQGRCKAFKTVLDHYRQQKTGLDGFVGLKEGFHNKLLAKLRAFCRARLMQDKRGWQSILPGCLGAGKGLTPASDDALVGIMAVIWGAVAVGLIDNNQNYQRFDEIIADRTTDVSKKYLLCANEGRFSDVLLHLVSVVFTDADANWVEIIKAVGNVGGTSGMDMLLGVEIGLASLNEYYSGVLHEVIWSGF